MRNLRDRNFSQGFLKVTSLVAGRTTTEPDHRMVVNQGLNFCNWCVVDAFSMASQEMGQTGLYRDMNMLHKKRRKEE